MKRRELPRAVGLVVWTFLAVVVLTGLAVLFMHLEIDSVIRSWAAGNPSAQEILASGGMEALRESKIVPKFVPLAFVSYIVLVVLVVVLVALFVDGHGWARHVLSWLCVLGVLVSVLGLRHDLPASLVVVAALLIVAYAVALVCLWHRQSSRHLRIN